MSNLDSSQADKSHGPPECSGRLADPSGLTPEVFDPHVGESFRVTRQQFENADTHVNPLKTGEEGKCEVIELKLVEVTRYPKLKEIERGFEHRVREPFALLFEGPAEPTLMSAQHTVEHAMLGTGRLFLNPVQVAVPRKSVKQPEVRFYETPFG